MPENDPPSAIRNLGPASDEFYGRAGLNRAELIRDLGADEAYFLALQAGGQPHFIGYYALVMGLQGRPWNDCIGDEKDALKQRFEAIKKRLKQSDHVPPGIERDLDQIGVGQRR